MSVYDPERIQALDDTARLLLMENPAMRYLDFHKALKDEHMCSLPESRDVYARYMGWDGRVAATHSIDTGERLR